MAMSAKRSGPQGGEDAPMETVAGRVLGIDPGLGVTGYAVVDSSRNRPYVVEAGVPGPRGVRGEDDRTDGSASTRGCSLRSSTPSRRRRWPSNRSIAITGTRGRRILMAHARGVIVLAAALRGCRSSPRGAPDQEDLTGSGRAPRSRCSTPSASSWGWTPCPSPMTSPTPAPWPFAIIRRGTAGLGRTLSGHPSPTCSRMTGRSEPPTFPRGDRGPCTTTSRTDRSPDAPGRARWRRPPR